MVTVPFFSTSTKLSVCTAVICSTLKLIGVLQFIDTCYYVYAHYYALLYRYMSVNICMYSTVLSVYIIVENAQS